MRRGNRFSHLRGSLLSRPAALSGRLRWRVQGSIPGEPHFRRGPLFALVWRLGLADQRCWTFDIGQFEAKPHEKLGVLVSVRLRNADERPLRIRRHFGDRTPTCGLFSLETAGRPSRGAPSFQVRYSHRLGHHCHSPQARAAAGRCAKMRGKLKARLRAKATRERKFTSGPLASEARIPVRRRFLANFGCGT